MKRGQFRLSAEADPPRARVVIEELSLLPRIDEHMSAFVICESGTPGGTVPVHDGFSGLSEGEQARLRVTIIDTARARSRRAGD